MAVSASAPELPAAARAGRETLPGVTAAVCTRGRPAELHRALRSLAGQTAPPAEVLVVDNAPEDERTRELVAREFPDVRYVREPRLGLDFARNRALAESSREVVAFLDDDAVAEPDWVARIQRVFSEGERIAVCTGRVEAFSLEHEGQRLFEANGGFARGSERIRLPRPGRRLRGLPAPLVAWSISVGSGCSLAVRREVALGLGGFDEALDLGEALPGGGDLDLIWRVLGDGREVVYEPAVRARHEHRREAAAAVRQIAEHHRALVAFLTKALARARGRERLSVLAFLLWRLVKPGLRLVGRGLGRDPLPAAALLLVWWSCWRGLRSYHPARRVAGVHGGRD